MSQEFSVVLSFTIYAFSHAFFYVKQTDDCSDIVGTINSGRYISIISKCFLLKFRGRGEVIQI